MSAAGQHDRSACYASSIVSSGFVSRGWALIQSVASRSEVNFPKWCTDRLGHTIFTRQILPSCTGDNRALIDASMIRPARSYKPCACPLADVMREEDFFTIFAKPDCPVEANEFLPLPRPNRSANAMLAAAPSDQTNNKKTSNKVARDFRINVRCRA
jgi:hypothetical protein